MTEQEWYQHHKAAAQPHIAARLRKSYGAHGRRWGTHQEEAAAEGEIAMARWYGGEPDFRLFEYGDGGVDVYLLLAMPAPAPRQWWEAINVKAVWRRPRYLLIPATKPFQVEPEVIYVQASRPEHQDEDDNALIWQLNGWMRGDEVMRFPVEDFMENGRLVHKVPSWEENNQLHPMAELERTYLGWWRHRGLPARRASYPQALVAEQSI